MEPLEVAHRGPLPCRAGGDVARAAPRGPGCAPDESGVRVLCGFSVFEFWEVWEVWGFEAFGGSRIQGCKFGM